MAIAPEETRIKKVSVIKKLLACFLAVMSILLLWTLVVPMFIYGWFQQAPVILLLAACCTAALFCFCAPRSGYTKGQNNSKLPAAPESLSF